ncbi:MAG: hypothetical protein ACPG32_13150 [Akkermansiaceae bacterium]
MITHRTHSALFLLLCAPALLADTSFDNTDKFAWSANTGWISLRHDRPASPEGVLFGEAYLSGYAYSANLGWINFGDGTPSNGHTYSNASNDHGVNHDGTGNLSGYAWSANTGWINFGWAAAANANRPKVDLATGVFSGYAWSANTGWVNLGTGKLTAASMHCPDTDSDGIADHWEELHFGNLSTVNSTSDHDGDGVSDPSEYAANTDPDDASNYLKIISQNYNVGYTEITVVFTSNPNRRYRIEYSADLGITPPWTNSPLGTFSPDSGTSTTKTFTFAATTEAKYFFRAVAVRPLSP